MSVPWVARVAAWGMVLVDLGYAMYWVSLFAAIQRETARDASLPMVLERSFPPSLFVLMAVNLIVWIAVARVRRGAERWWRVERARAYAALRSLGEGSG